RYPGLRRPRDGQFRTVGDFLQRDRINASTRQPGRAVWAVGLRVDARAGQAQHRLRELRDGRIGPRLDQRELLFVRIDGDLWRRFSIEDIDDVLRRQQVFLRLLRGND